MYSNKDIEICEYILLQDRFRYRRLYIAQCKGLFYIEII